METTAITMHDDDTVDSRASAGVLILRSVLQVEGGDGDSRRAGESIISKHGSGAPTICGGGTADTSAMAIAEDAISRIVVERLKDIEEKINNIAKDMERDRLKWRRDKGDMMRALVNETKTHVTEAKAEMSASMSSVAAATVHLAPRARTAPSSGLSDADNSENQSELEAMPNMSVEDAVKANQKLKGRVKKWFIEKKYGFV